MIEDLRGKVAVVTGAASGIGAALARHFAAAGMQVVLADIEVDALDKATGRLIAEGADVICVRTDVSSLQDVTELFEAATSRFGAVDVLCNNAGVTSAGRFDQLSLKDWRWVLDVNLWGVINGCHTFVPHMLERRTGHVVNTASVAGFTSAANTGPYSASKHAVVALTECLREELAAGDTGVGVSLLCPGLVATRIASSERNRPRVLATDPADRADVSAHQAAEREERARQVARWVESGISPDRVAEFVVAAITLDRFYVFTDDQYDDAIKARHTRIEAALGRAGRL